MPVCRRRAGWGLYTHAYFAQILVWAVPLLTHAASEQAMDRHIARHLFRPTAKLLQADDWLVDCVAHNFGCIPAASCRAISQPAGAESLLRHSLPNMLHGMGRLLDRRLSARFYCIQEASTRLPLPGDLFEAETPLLRSAA